MTSVTIPSPVAPTEIELNWIESEPPGLFPMDQDSVWGQMRKLFTDDMQGLADQLAQWYLNLDPSTCSDDDLSNWEYELGIPDGTGNVSALRKAFIQSRRQRGPFTNARRNALGEGFIAATFNPPIQFTSSGVPFPSGGIPFGSELTSLVGTYNIYQDVRNFFYKVWITSNTVVDVPGLTRELLRITPAGMTFAIDGTRSVPIDYPGLIKSDRPMAYFPLGTNGADIIGKYAALTPTVVGAPTFNAAPGLLAANIGADGDVSLNGSSAFTYPDVDAFDFVGLSPFSVEAWIDPAALDSANHEILIKQSSGGWAFFINTNNQIAMQRSDGSSTDNVVYTLPDANKHHVVGTFDGTTMRMYLDGALVASSAATKVLPSSSAILRLGSSSGASFWNGLLDAVAIYDYCLSAAQVARHHTTGIGSFA